MSNKYTILIIEDENSISSILKMVFTANGYNAYTAKNGAEAMMMVNSYCPDLVILDLVLPDMDGLEILKSIREWSSMPIIVVSARTHEHDKVEALDLGADDYISKPFGTAELLARVRAGLRHSNSGQSGMNVQLNEFCVGELCVDYNKRRVFINGKDAGLTQNEYKIVSLLAKYAGKVLTYDYIIKNIWGPNMKCDNQILRVNMANIRRKIEKSPAEPVYIITEIGVGYRMIEVL
ncbi:response regulators consisting of a CheY-like receiver domain and a winged-helix DNA-binding domain [Ruminococcus sp. CAG:624]|nr:response regulators consisting of a CheY-like receiver domain and a winged-helix DNA-binding domain [Ruminococcus sp. CAG:624]